MRIILNGNEKEFTNSQNLRALVEEFAEGHTRVIAELNGEIIKTQHWSETNLQNGDKVELVSFVGGG